MTTPAQDAIAPVLAGPILRRVEPGRLTLWLATRAPARLRLTLLPPGLDRQQHELTPGDGRLRHLRAGSRLHYLLVDLPLDTPLPADALVEYDIEVDLDEPDGDGWQSLHRWAPDLCYPGRQHPAFRVPGRIDTLLHGSCRKPHHDSGDGLVAADAILADCLGGTTSGTAGPRAMPALLVLSGDQIYADDVAGPMLRAIHALIDRLGIPAEALADMGIPGVPDAPSLYAHADGYYRRERLLPDTEARRDLVATFFAGVRKPVFTADSAHNHLVTLAEVLAMYLLVWSPAPWEGLEVTPPEALSPQERHRFEHEARAIRRFAKALSRVRRVFAHVATAMIFDDHDVTDDWNLNREWEEIAYGHPFSRRIVGNALIGYLVNQGWGNDPAAFDDLMDDVDAAMRQPGSPGHDALIDDLLALEKWDFSWPTDPPLIALDTRTRRWRSERSARRPSGLLDWEALTDLQRALRGLDRVLLVSAAPIFGVKLIENLQKLFTWLGKPLTVDAEYWLAHPGTAHGILNVFSHRKTPRHFVVLSGDVHYSFVYDVELRRRPDGPDIWQICSSGLRNEFPARLLGVLDHLNRWLYSPRSPLNWLTRRRSLRIIPRKPRGTPSGRRLLNGAGIGVVELDEQGAPWRISHRLAGGNLVEFERREGEARWD